MLPKSHHINFPNTFRSRFLFICLFVFNIYNSQGEIDEMQQLKNDEGKMWTLYALTWLENVLENLALSLWL